MALSITVATRSAGVVVLLLRGSMRLADADSFRMALARVLHAHRPAKVQVDFAAVTEIDSGAAVLVTDAAREAARGETAVTIVDASSAVDQRIRLAGGEGLLR